jgi:hypothetical protein
MKLQRANQKKPEVIRMSQAQAVSPLALALVAGGFTTFGVVLKIGYDAIAARRAAKAAGLERFADERRQTYETFYDSVKKQLEANKALMAMVEAHHKEGKTEISEEEKAAVPPSAIAEVVAALEQIRRLARNYTVIAAAEAILRLLVDMTRTMGAALNDPEPNDEIVWFVLQRFLEDRVDEFVHGYREDLGLGPPAGAPKKWPMAPRERPFGWSAAQAEAALRAHIPIKILPKATGQSPETKR